MHTPEMSSKTNEKVDNERKFPSFDAWQQEQSNAEQEKIEAFNKFVDFCKKDTNIKQTLANLAPTESDFYGDASIAYSDKLYKGFQDIQSDLGDIMQNFYPSDTIEDRLKGIKNDTISAGADPWKLQRCYQDDFTAMSPDFNTKVRQNTIGYSTKNPHELDQDAHSINEMLHLVHSSIVNNEDTLQSLPILESKNNEYDTISLYGTEETKNPIAKDIYDQLKDSKESYTDIVSLPDRTLMMVRDRGHALTLDIAKDPDNKYYVDYFIPKICNVDKINQLPGVRKVIKKDNENQVNDFTTGMFSVDNEGDVANQVVSFIKQVPTDNDIEFSYSF